VRIAILQSNYIPWKGYFDLINDADVFVFYDCVKYTKNDWRNRNKIYVTASPQWITIPITSESTKIKIEDVKITNTSWQETHAKTLTLGYKKAPFFFQLEELIQDYFIEKKWNRLSELNQYIIKDISRRLRIKTKFINSQDLTLMGDRVEKLVNICKQLNATEYISGPAAKDYLLEKEYLFSDNNISLSYKSYPQYKPYKQIQMPFENTISIVDMIANLEWNDIPSYIWGNE
jgi:archaellin